ncbi:MAG: HlyD family efflux transporter periplasmic adaptor subunit [Lachnospiraceae bacterium]|nr:HlyD family efflux transporter periplasmic adaptor subunit [Lachnospiraceae bacterium]
MQIQTKNKKKFLIGGGAAAVAGIAVICVCLVVRRSGGEDVVYRETTIAYGNLTVGISDDSSVEIGTLEQTFDLDIRALVDSDSTSDSQSAGGSFGTPGGMGGGNNSGNNGGMMSFGSFNTGYASQDQSLEVASVAIAIGQEIKEGDVLYTLTQESVDEIRDALSEDINDTKADYDALQVEQQASRTQAQQKYDTYVTNGKYAQLIYENELSDYQKKLDDAIEAVNDIQDEYNEKLLELSEVQEELDGAQKFLKEAQGAVSENYAGRYENAYYYTVYLNTRDTAQKLADELEEKLDNLNEEIEQTALDIQAAVRAMNQAQLDYDKAQLELKQTYDIDAYYSNMASEWYSIQTASLDNELSQAKGSYDSAVEKLDEFDGYVQNNCVLSEYSGVITDVMLSEGDTISGGSGLVVLYDQTAVTMDVSLGEDDYNAIDKEGVVNITYTAYPDLVYSGIISEVSDAEYDSSSGSVYYTVTVTVQGDVSGLYEGMTGNVTFVTKETKEVCYVSNRAITREGTHSYVKMRDESGKVIQKEVTTGFSDGVNVEIVEGLSEGDVVLIESKVGEA